MSGRPIAPWKQLSDARRALGAGPLWGRPAAAILVPAYGAGLLLACRGNWLTLPALIVCAVIVGGIVFAVASSWIRGVDFNAWLEADPRHRRGSCQWLIWRGEYSGQPCLACLATMPRRERRSWLEAAASPAVRAGWLGESGGGTPAPVRDAGSVRVEWLVWQLLPVGLLAAAVHQWTSSDPADRQAALPLALAVLLVAGINLHRARHARTSSDADDPAAAGPGPCESCGWVPGSVTVRFADGVQFLVCATCLAGGVHHSRQPVDGTTAAAEVSR